MLIVTLPRRYTSRILAYAAAPHDHRNRYASLIASTTLMKSYLAFATLFGATFSVYFFIRHNNYCEPFIYTLFALSEFVVVLSNMAFNFQAYYDFADLQLQVVLLEGDQETHADDKELLLNHYDETQSNAQSNHVVRLKHSHRNANRYKLFDVQAI